MASIGCCDCCAGAKHRPGPATARAAGSSTTNWQCNWHAAPPQTLLPSTPCSTPRPRRHAACENRSGRPWSRRLPMSHKPRWPTMKNATARACVHCRTQSPPLPWNCNFRKASWHHAACWKVCSTARVGPAHWPAGDGTDSNRAWRPCLPLPRKPNALARNQPIKVTAGSTRPPSTPQPRHGTACLHPAQYSKLRVPYGAIAQLGERVVRNDEVGSSILPGSTNA